MTHPSPSKTKGSSGFIVPFGFKVEGLGIYKGFISDLYRALGFKVVGFMPSDTVQGVGKFLSN